MTIESSATAGIPDQPAPTDTTPRPAAEPSGRAHLLRGLCAGRCSTATFHGIRASS